MHIPCTRSLDMPCLHRPATSRAQRQPTWAEAPPKPSRHCSSQATLPSHHGKGGRWRRSRRPQTERRANRPMLLPFSTPHSAVKRGGVGSGAGLRSAFRVLPLEGSGVFFACPPSQDYADSSSEMVGRAFVFHGAGARAVLTASSSCARSLHFCHSRVSSLFGSHQLRPRCKPPPLTPRTALRDAHGRTGLSVHFSSSHQPVPVVQVEQGESPSSDLPTLKTFHLSVDASGLCSEPSTRTTACKPAARHATSSLPKRWSVPHSYQAQLATRQCA